MCQFEFGGWEGVARARPACATDYKELVLGPKDVTSDPTYSPYLILISVVLFSGRLNILIYLFCCVYD